jgi:hypothetical protein
VGKEKPALLVDLATLKAALGGVAPETLIFPLTEE